MNTNEKIVLGLFIAGFLLVTIILLLHDVINDKGKTVLLVIGTLIMFITPALVLAHKNRIDKNEGSKQ